MEAELRFGGNAYPTEMCEFPFRLMGQGFFPGGDGLWREHGALGASTDGDLPRGGVVFVGNDFGTISSFRKLQKKSYENVPTWRHLKIRVERAGIPKDKTFFTNAVVGLRKDGLALEKVNRAELPAFAEFCAEFLSFQLDVLSPQLVVVMGPQARSAFENFHNRTNGYDVLFMRHPYGDFGLSGELKDRETQELAAAWNKLS